jgi:hypothetical protein
VAFSKNVNPGEGLASKQYHSPAAVLLHPEYRLNVSSVREQHLSGRKQQHPAIEDSGSEELRLFRYSRHVTDDPSGAKPALFAAL